ncbi:hypothetical protein DM860_007100 [Cuscuta australis]|uniref:Glycoside hydrolase family 5 domain-containing protein n=1 Tax=Cuscuta australis TaxID=267555 RepID=A0A328E9S9_9ASTE|nr:hypothetical protein DM860_007100 [Cuscuta australis]
MIPVLTATILLSFAPPSCSLPLSTSSRWIVDDQTGRRVKLACASWSGHLETMLPEGLDRRPLSEIVADITVMGFNCVRLTWATYMYTRYPNKIVQQSLSELGLRGAIAGVARNNPSLLGMSLVDARRAVVEEIGRQGVMMVLDNHVSKPMWCCNDTDGNGFFGSMYFGADEWLHGLDIVARLFHDIPMVIGISLRNELRGPLQNVDTWYQNIEKGARTINNANPNLLVIISGLSYDLDFRFLKQRPLELNDLKNKLVYEAHRYAFSEGQSKLWTVGPLNKICQSMTQEMEEKEGFLVRENTYNAPLFVSEFGINQMGDNEADNLHLPCLLSYLADLDLDWSVWALQGSYYIRDGQEAHDETYGMFNTDWTSVRNQTFLSKLKFLQKKLQDPMPSNPTYHLLYHPLSGQCAQVIVDRIYMSNCADASRCIQVADGKPIKMIDVLKCVTITGEDTPVVLSDTCTDEKNNMWTLASNSMLQLTNKGDNGLAMCLDFNPSQSSSILLARKCVGLGEGDMANPQTQWFKLIASNA